MKKIAVPLFLMVFSLALLSVLPMWSTKALFRDVSKSKISIKAATLSLIIGDNWSRLSKPWADLGEIKPGDSGTVEIAVSNTGSIPGKLCVTELILPPEYLQVKSNDLCDLTIDPEGSVQIVIDWSLPAELHNTGLDGTEFGFSYSVLFENGYKITQKVILNGIIADPTDTPTPTATETVVPTDTQVPPETPENTPTSTATETPTEIIVEPTEIPVETPTPVEISTEVPTEVPSDVPTEIQVEPTVEIPTEPPAPTEKPAEVPDETPVS